ncbi:MAG: glycosyltransferase [Elusimicrobia bacterium]|nr:glycosyltransferase [Elusimicrobiota bacterium]
MIPLFTVITPAYNRPDFLRMALKSLSLQTFKNYEAFIIDDGSTDDTPKVFEEFKNHENWKFIRFETNKRQFYCRNFAIERASGKYITFLDADDMWLPERLEKFHKAFEKHPETGFMFSNGYIMQDNLVADRFFEKNRKIPAGKIEPYMAISDKWLPYVTTNVAFIKKAVEKTGLFRYDMSHLEDMELYVRILRHFEVNYIAEPLSIYRIHSLTANPKSLTLRWEDGIKDFITSLETANPPLEKRKELEDYVYRKQAAVFLKNSLNSKAREYIFKTSSRDAGFYLVYLGSFLPKSALLVLKTVYRMLRSINCRWFVKSNYTAAQKFVNSLR